MFRVTSSEPWSSFSDSLNIEDNETPSGNGDAETEAEAETDGDASDGDVGDAVEDKEEDIPDVADDDAAEKKKTEHSEL